MLKLRTLVSVQEDGHIMLCKGALIPSRVVAILVDIKKRDSKVFVDDFPSFTKPVWYVESSRLTTVDNTWRLRQIAC